MDFFQFMDLEKYCDEDFINIPKDDWLNLLHIADTKEKKDHLACELAKLTERYDPPIPKPAESDMKKDYLKFKDYKCEIFETDSYLRAGPYKYEVSKNTLKFFRWGSIVADAYMLPVMLQASHRRYQKNIYELWGTFNGRKTAFNSLINLKKPKVDKKMVLVGFKMRLQIVANYKPVVAREIYNIYGKSGTVLDFCSGYGGRMIGFWGSNCKKYIGIDPNSQLVEPYMNLKNWLSKIDPQEKTIEMHKSTAEDFNYNEEVDLIFTSPPYFNLERYSKEETQSWIKYKAIDDWKEKFLFTTLRKAYKCLKKDGYIIINICDSESHPELRICDDMMDVLVKELGMKQHPGMKMLLSNRPGNKIKPGTLRVAEPMWIVQKVS